MDKGRHESHALGTERTVMAILGRAGVSTAARGANNIGKGVRQREKAVRDGRRQYLFPIGGGDCTDVDARPDNENDTYTVQCLHTYMGKKHNLIYVGLH